MSDPYSKTSGNQDKSQQNIIERHIQLLEDDLVKLEASIKSKRGHLHELKKKRALNRLRELQKYRDLSQPFESEDSLLLEMQELMDFLKEDPDIKAYLEKSLYHKI